ncbi:hypothetical protein [Sphingomonas sp. NFR04]|uniref:hypothetical protein n=1 Tax=Sphingomonas sp. NFR04 TaxID=1566283 RepID=UPI001113BF62|nr:hypothetical protein [Sphingomonas sp. NFR04]
MTITVGGQPTEYVIDRAPTAGSCLGMLRRTNNQPLYRVPAHIKPAGDIAMVSFACERTKVMAK